MQAHAFSKPIKPASSYNFGIDPASSAAELRRIADAVEKGEVTIESARVLTVATGDEFTSTILRLKVFERVERERPISDLLREFDIEPFGSWKRNGFDRGCRKCRDEQYACRETHRTFLDEENFESEVRKVARSA